jgi:hypothetical protein
VGRNAKLRRIQKVEMPKGYPKSGTRNISPATRCAVCRHPERIRIEALHTAGSSLDKLAERFDLHRDAIWRHMTRHVTEERKVNYLIGAGKLQKLVEVAADENVALIDYYSIIRSILLGQLDRLAEKGEDFQSISAIAQRLIETLKEIGKVTGQVNNLASSTIINVQNNFAILNSPPFADLQSGLLQLCAAHPDARADVVRLFRDLEVKYAAPVPPRLLDTPAGAR